MKGNAAIRLPGNFLKCRGVLEYSRHLLIRTTCSDDSCIPREPRREYCMIWYKYTRPAVGTEHCIASSESLLPPAWSETFSRCRAINYCDDMTRSQHWGGNTAPGSVRGTGVTLPAQHTPPFLPVSCDESSATPSQQDTAPGPGIQQVVIIMDNIHTALN